MKASELITLLQDAIDKYGDLPLSCLLPSEEDFMTDKVRIQPIDKNFNDEFDYPEALIIENKF